MLRDDNIDSLMKPKLCKCGAKARIRYRIPYFWVECDKKCGMKTGFHADGDEQYDPRAKAKAVVEWNRMVNGK